MERFICGVAIWICADPAVMMFGGVQRLRHIADEMSHHAHDVDDVGLRIGDLFGRAAVILERFQIGKSRAKFTAVFRYRPRREADEFASVVGVLGRINRFKLFWVRGA